MAVITVAQLAGWFEDAAGRVLNADLSPTLTRARDWIAQDTARGFATSTTPDGKPWAPIHHRVGKPLIDSGLMYLSVIDQINDGVVAGNTLTIRVAHPHYAIYHQFGTSRIKQREWLGLADLTKKRIYADAAVEVIRQIISGSLPR